MIRQRKEMGNGRNRERIGRRQPGNWLDYLKATGYGGEAFYENRPAVTDGNVITASGIAPLEFARKS